MINTEFEKYEAAALAKLEAKNAEKAEKEKKSKQAEKKVKASENLDIDNNCKIVELTDEEANKLQAELDNKVSIFYFPYIFFYFRNTKSID